MKASSGPSKAHRSSGRKPSVAFRNQEKARSNIRIKLLALKQLSERFSKAAPQRAQDWELREWMLPLLPRSLRQFNAWASQSVSATRVKSLEHLGMTWASFRTNANATLALDPVLRSEVEAALLAVRLLPRTSVGQEEKKADRLASLRRKVELAELLKSIAEGELKAVLRQVNDLNDEVTALKKKLEAMERETKRMLLDREREITELRVRFSERPKRIVSIQSNLKKESL